MEKGEIILYQPNDTVLVEVRMEKETVWLTQAQISELFGTKRQAITKHLKNIFECGELSENSVCSILELTAADGKIYDTKIYNLDAILSVGYRVNSINATLFRRWANQVLKDYLLKGYSIRHETDVAKLYANHENRITELEKNVDFFVKTSLPPQEGVFFEGQIFDAYIFASDLIKSATKTIILIDNYIDESVLLILSKRSINVRAEIYTKQITAQLQLDLEKHNTQYEPIIMLISTSFHDRFLIIDNTVYHIGASLKDLGKKLFAFSKMEIKDTELLKNI
ncbi:MAG: virulence RhuM family protein [Chitinispirillales bacterium]|jgi:hypothetical protein|nr:virulence RhuM family protein [Chitinispirillales bacterium]